MSVTVELYGMARLQTGVERIRVSPGTLEQVLLELQQRLPALQGVCIQDGRLLPGFTININRRRFTRSAQTRVVAGDVLMLLSADPGG